MKTLFISRTITYSEIKVISLHLSTMEPGSNVYTIPGDYSKVDANDLLRDVRETLETDEIKIAGVKVINTRTEKRVMSIQKFIENSEIATKETEEEKGE